MHNGARTVVLLRDAGPLIQYRTVSPLDLGVVEGFIVTINGRFPRRRRLRKMLGFGWHSMQQVGEGSNTLAPQQSEQSRDKGTKKKKSMG